MIFQTKKILRVFLLALIGSTAMVALSVSLPAEARGHGGGNPGGYNQGGGFGDSDSDRGRQGGDPYGYEQRMDNDRNSQVNQDWDRGGNSQVVPGQYPGQGQYEGAFPGQGNTQGVFPGGNQGYPGAQFPGQGETGGEFPGDGATSGAFRGGRR